MKENQEIVSELNKLVEINNDRYEGYKKAADETTDSDLKSLFNEYAAQSSKFRSELATEVKKLGGTAVEGTTTSGKFYRAWMDIKTAITGKDRKAVLNSCEYGEDVAKGVYHDVIGENEEFSSDLHNIISHQLDSLTEAHDKIKSLRDAVEA